MKHWIRLGAAGVLIITLAAGWAIMRQARATSPGGGLEASGRIEGEDVLVSSKVGGRVSRLLVQDGDAVREGQLIAVLQSGELDAQLRQADARVQTAQARVRRADGELAVLDAQHAQARTAVVLAEAQVRAQQRRSRASLAAGLARMAQARQALTVTRQRAPTAVEDAQAVVRAAEADFVRARAARDLAQRNAARLEALLQAGAVAAAQVEAARAAFEAASAQLGAAGEQVQRGRLGVDLAMTGLLDIQLREEEVRAADAAVDAARSEVALAQAGALEVTRQRQQLESVLRQTEIAQAGLAAATAQHSAAVAARDELAAVRQETSVYAPRVGTIVHRVANQGEVLAPGAPIVVLVDLQALWLKVYVPAADVARLRLGLPARISVDGYPGRSFDAAVTEISARAEFTPKDVQTREDRVTQVVAVKLRVDNRDGSLKPGMPADAVILWNGTASR